MSSSTTTTTTTLASTKESGTTLILSLRDYLHRVSNDDDTTSMSADDKQDAMRKQQQPAVQLILASQSPRRREILDMMGLQNRYQTIPSPLDEAALAQELQLRLSQQPPVSDGASSSSSSTSIDPAVYTRTLAEHKAMALAQALVVEKTSKRTTSSTTTTILILGSDTVVAYDGRLLEKPIDTSDAIQMLQLLQGKTHTVHTGVALVAVVPLSSDNDDDSVQLVHSFTDSANVRFASLTDKDIESYVATKEPMDKAGSYGIQGIGGQLVESIEGDFFTVMGLPMHRTSLVLASAVSDILQKAEQPVR